MTVEIIEAIGTHIVIPICAFGFGGFVIWLMWRG